MTDTPPSLVPDDDQSRDRLRVLLTLCCVAAVVLAATVLPAVSSAGLGDSPLGSVVPQPAVDPYSQGGAGGMPAGAGGASGPSGGSLGALNPGDRTSVGGPLASDEGASAFRSQNAAVHFTVESAAPSYWRTGAYDTYTDSGWERSSDRESYAGPLESEGLASERVEYRVTLNQSATALPSVWRPKSISASREVFVTDRQAFETDEPLAAGTSYVGVSERPPRNPTVLGTAGRDYPAEIDARYTDLPADTDRRLSAFTANLTADADNPYETATRIEEWLEANKDYSLNASAPEGDVASEFVFEMDEGYCEYFATAMTAMLRSQDVPARYVVGYSTGQQVAEDTYQVRGLNAHAWVEVYFPDVGWVRFDPTPGSDRLQAEQDAVANQTDPPTDYEPVEEGSPGETFSPNGSADETPGGTPTGETAPPTGTRDGGSDAPSSTPSGESGTGSGTTAGDGAAPSGTTDGAGGTRATTATDSGGEPTTDSGDRTESDEDGGADSSDEPRTTGGYEVELNRTPVPGATVTATVTRGGSPAVGVPVFFNDERVGTTDDAGAVAGEVPFARNLTVTVGGAARAEAVGAPAIDGFASLAPPARSLSQSNETNGSLSYALETNATLAVSGEEVTGGEVVVTATIDGVPVRDAAVRLDGERVATTDRRGRAELRLPDDPGNATITVSRGVVTGETVVSLPELSVSAAPSLPLALPGSAVEVTATYGDDPVPNASVTVGDSNATTDINGTATATLPFRGSATAVVTADGQTARETVSGLLLNLVGVVVAALLAVGGLAFAAYRRGATPRSVARALYAAATALPRLVVGALFGIAAFLEGAIASAADAVRDLIAGAATPRELLERLRTWLRERARSTREQARAAMDYDGEPAGDDADDADDESYRTLRRAWREFLRLVSARRPSAMTPGELAAHAVEVDDLPPEAVATLRDAFRDVEYGARSPADRLPVVEEALAAIETAARPDDPDADPEGGDD